MEARNSAVTLYEAGAEGVDEFTQKMGEAPTALEVATAKMDNAKGATELLKGALETLQIVAIEPLLPMLKDMAESAVDLAEGFSLWLQSDQAAEWGAAIHGALSGALDMASAVWNFFNDNWTLIAPIVAGATAALVAYKVALIAINTWTKLVRIATLLWSGALLANPITWVVGLIGLLVAAIVGLILNWDKCVDAFKKGWIGIQNVFIAGANAVIGAINSILWAYNKVVGVFGGTQVESIGYIDFKTMEPDLPDLSAMAMPEFDPLNNGFAPPGGAASQFGYTPNVSPGAAMSPMTHNVTNDNSVGSFNMNVQIEGKQDDPKAMVDDIMKEMSKRTFMAGSQMGGK